MYILDTDSISLDQSGHPIVRAKISETPAEQLFTSIITVEEQFRGRLASIRKYIRNPGKLAKAYKNLEDTLRYFNRWNILLFTEEAYDIFRQLRQQGIRIGTQDLQIASIALLHCYTVVTRNRADFSRVEGLSIEDWTIPQTNPY